MCVCVTLNGKRETRNESPEKNVNSHMRADLTCASCARCEEVVADAPVDFRQKVAIGLGRSDPFGTWIPGRQKPDLSNLPDHTPLVLHECAHQGLSHHTKASGQWQYIAIRLPRKVLYL